MKALFSSAVAMLLVMQISCATSPLKDSVAKDPFGDAQLASAKTAADLPTPEVAVMPMKEGILIAWKPIVDADGYFVYRETQNPPSKSLVGIGPKEAQGFIDRNPPDNEVKYSVQAFKASERSNTESTKALPGTSKQSEQSDTRTPIPSNTKGTPVLRAM